MCLSNASVQTVMTASARVRVRVTLALKTLSAMSALAVCPKTTSPSIQSAKSCLERGNPA